MSFFGKLFGRGQDTEKSDSAAVAGAVDSLALLYDDPEVRSERGISLTGPRAEEVRGIGRRLARSGGKASLLAARDGLRERQGWAVANLEAIWASLPEWRTEG